MPLLVMLRLACLLLMLLPPPLLLLPLLLLLLLLLALPIVPQLLLLRRHHMSIAIPRLRSTVQPLTVQLRLANIRIEALQVLIGLP
jgi:hypothetical protein